MRTKEDFQDLIYMSDLFSLKLNSILNLGYAVSDIQISWIQGHDLDSIYEFTKGEGYLPDASLKTDKIMREKYNGI